LIAIFTSVPVDPKTGLAIPAGGDKVGHLLAYGGLGFLLCLALRAGTDRTRSRCALLALAIASAYGILDEWHQQWIPSRTASVLDWVADVIGASLGALTATWLGDDDDGGETANPADQ
jgi:VanZ family protein